MYMTLVGKDFKNALKEKLKEMQSEFADNSEMLIDFVEVMLNNEKEKEYVQTQLLDCKYINSLFRNLFNIGIYSNI